MRCLPLLLAMCVMGCDPVTAPTPVTVEPVVEAPVSVETTDLCDLYTGKDRETCLAFRPWGGR